MWLNYNFVVWNCYINCKRLQFYMYRLTFRFARPRWITTQRPRFIWGQLLCIHRHLFYENVHIFSSIPENAFFLSPTVSSPPLSPSLWSFRIVQDPFSIDKRKRTNYKYWSLQNTENVAEDQCFYRHVMCGERRKTQIPQRSRPSDLWILRSTASW